MPDDIPYIAIGNDELGGPLYEGELIPCPAGCGRNHPVSSWGPGDTLMTVDCGGRPFLVGIKGRRVPKSAAQGL